MAKSPTQFPVRGVPGGWRDEWSAPDDAATMRAQFAAWAARTNEAVTRSAPTDSANGGRGVVDRHIRVGISQPTNDPSQHRAFALRARYDVAAGGWVAEFGEQNRNDQVDRWEPEAGVATASLVFPTAAACLGAAVTRLIEAVDREATDPPSAR